MVVADIIAASIAPCFSRWVQWLLLFGALAKLRVVRAYPIYIIGYTQKQYQAVMGMNPSVFKNCGDCPVEVLTYDDTQAFITQLNKLQTNLTYRLPTEAEWEYAARGGSQSRHTLYPGSDTLDEVAWYMDNSVSKTHPVAQKKANELGLYDMAGNVDEWCSDWYGIDYYANSPSRNPQGPSWGEHRVIRGGYWSCYPQGCTVSHRYNYPPDMRSNAIGFRLAASAQ